MLHTLGQLTLEGNPLSRPKPLLLLAYLALEGPTSRRVLAELMYTRAQDPRDSLSSAIRYLQKRASEPLSLTHEKVGCTLPCDALLFQTLIEEQKYEESLRYYRGPFLKDVGLDGAEELEEWLLAKREHFAALAREAHLNLAERALVDRKVSTARSHAEDAFTLEGASPLEQLEALKLHRLLTRTRSALLARFKAELKALYLSIPEHAAKPHNLPQPLTSFVGRVVERRALTELLGTSEVRLLTVHGPPGVGKTRLSLQSALEHLGTPRFRDGVFFVPLEAVTDPAEVPIAVLEAMELGLEGPLPALTQVGQQLAVKHILLVLDNFEHIIEARTLLTDLLKVCPNVSLLVTSRERLNVEAEWVLTLEGLPVPAETYAFEDTDVAHALQLFVQRARQARLDFELDEDDLPHTRTICRLVDGFPLGLELAAAWVGLQPLENVALALGHNVMALETPLKGIHERHRSIRAAFEYSWLLLSDEEQRTLRQLTVLSGGFDYPAAEALSGATLGTLKQLVDKSLLRVDKRGRFNFHPLLHQFASEKLSEHPRERAACQEKQGRYFLRFLAPKYEDIMGGPQTRAALDAIERETANLRLAWSWAVKEKRADLLLDPVASLGLYCETRSRFQLGTELLAELIGGLDETDREHQFTLGAAYGMQGFLLIRAQSGGAALEMAAKGQELLRPFRLSTRNWALWMALEASVGAHWARGELDEGERYVRENLALARADRDHARGDIDLRVAEVFAGISLHVLGMFEIIRGHYTQAIPYLEESRDLLDKHSSITLSYSLWNLGQAELHTGRLERARSTLERGLELSQALGYSTMVAYILTDLARVYLALGEPDMARALCQDVIGMTQRNGDRRLEATAMVIMGQTLTRQNTEEVLGRFRRALALAIPIGALECATEALAEVCTLWAQGGLRKQSHALSQVVLAHPATSAATRANLEQMLQDHITKGELLEATPTLHSPADLEKVVQWVDYVLAQRSV